MLKSENKASYSLFVDVVRAAFIGEEISIETPDKVTWNDSAINKEELNQILAEL